MAHKSGPEGEGLLEEVHKGEGNRTNAHFAAAETRIAPYNPPATPVQARATQDATTIRGLAALLVGMALTTGTAAIYFSSCRNTPNESRTSSTGAAPLPSSTAPDGGTKIELPDAVSSNPDSSADAETSPPSQPDAAANLPPLDDKIRDWQGMTEADRAIVRAFRVDAGFSPELPIVAPPPKNAAPAVTSGKPARYTPPGI